MQETKTVNPVNPVFSAITRNSDAVLSVSVILVLALMVVPLPSWLLDILLTLSISIALTTLMITTYITKPLELAVFPSILLMLTLFRLSLNVASTRLILSDAYAGRVIEAFGVWVVRGNYVVGFIIFIIIVIINFLVIVKGSGRIAEVAARFTLDAMPGKQMAIDADLNAGIITEKETRTRRADIAREAEFYGAMDGASKFVRGDAIAGIIITAVNIVGGFIIGVAQHGMSFTDALSTYTMLTIGDGLVTQIPALIVSTAAGVIVTRAASDSNLGTDIQRQFFSQPKALLIASTAMIFFGIMPGIPTVPFLLLGGIVALIGYFSRQMIAEKAVEEEAKVPLVPEAPEKVEDYLIVDPMELEIGYGLIPLVDAEQHGDLLTRITTMRKQLALEMGIIVPPIRIRDNIQLEANDYVIKIRGVDVSRGVVYIGQFLAMNPGTATEELEGIKTTEPAFNLPAYWIDESQRERAELSGYTVVEASAVVATHLMEIIKGNADKILGRQETQTLINNLKTTYSAVVEEVTPGILSVGAIQHVLQNLLRERIPIRDLVTILETLADYGSLTKDTDILTEYVRQSLATTITKMYQNERGIISALTLDPRIERVIEEGVRQSQQAGVSFSLPPELLTRLYQSLSKGVEDMISRGLTPMVITSPAVRLHFKRLVTTVFPQLVVVSYNELTPTVQVESAGGVRIENAD